MDDEARRDADLAGLSRAAELAGITAEIILPEDRHTRLRGLRFHYVDWGNAQAPAILFLHGSGLTAHTYDLVCVSLRAEYHCVALDLRGHGDSDWSAEIDYEVATHAADIAAFLEQLGLARVAIAGMSLGGLAAIKHAGTRPPELAALAIIDVGPELQLSGAARISEFMSQPAELDSIEEFVDRAVAFNPRRDPLILRRSLLHNLRRTTDGRWTWKWDPRPRAKGVDLKAMAERRLALWSDVDRISCPTIVVRGAESEIFSREDATRLTERLGDGRLAVVDRAGHNVQGDAPAELARVLTDFLRSVGYGRGT